MASPPPKLSCLFPNPTLIDLSKPMPKLTYRKFFFSRAGQPTPDILDLGSHHTAMYTATLDDTNEEVIVKFTARYNEAAHRLLAKKFNLPRTYTSVGVVVVTYT